MTTVSIVDDDCALCSLLRLILSKAGALEVVSTHPNAQEALREIPCCRPEIVLMDIKMPGLDGIECTRLLRGVHPPLPSRILILTDYADEALVFEAMRAGADGYLSKNRISEPDLTQAIKNAASGEAVITPNIARKIFDHFRQPVASIEELSNREEEVLANLAEGLLYKQIAAKLAISLNTVRQHIRSIYEKLHVQSRAYATLKYMERRDPATRTRTF